MFTKIKDYFSQKKEIRTLTLDTLTKMNHIATTINNLTNSLSSVAEIFNTAELQNTIENINKIAQSPELTSAYYSHIADIAHEEKMAELNKNH